MSFQEIRRKKLGTVNNVVLTLAGNVYRSWISKSIRESLKPDQHVVEEYQESDRVVFEISHHRTKPSFDHLADFGLMLEEEWMLDDGSTLGRYCVSKQKLNRMAEGKGTNCKLMLINLMICLLLVILVIACIRLYRLFFDTDPFEEIYVD